MNKNTLFGILIVILLISNLLLALQIFRHPKPGGRKMEGPKKEIIQRLDFSENQIRDYDALIEMHQADIRELEDQLRQQKNVWLKGLKNPESEMSNAALDSVVSIQRKIEGVHFNHFMEIRKICTAAQIVDFDLLVDDLSKLFNKKPKKRAR